MGGYDVLIATNDTVINTTPAELKKGVVELLYQHSGLTRKEFNKLLERGDWCISFNDNDDLVAELDW